MQWLGTQALAPTDEPPPRNTTDKYGVQYDERGVAVMGIDADPGGVYNVPPGRHVIEFRCDGERVTSEGDPREIVFRVINCRMQVLDTVNNEGVLARHDSP